MRYLKILFSLPKTITPMERFKNYLRVLFIWCPIVTVLFIFGFGDLDNLSLRFAISIIISMTVATTCFLGSSLLNFSVNFFRRWRGLKPREDGLLWGVLISFPALLPGLYFGFTLAGKYSDAVGHAWTPPKFNDYSSGVIFGIMVSGFFTLFGVLRESKDAKREAELKYRLLESEKLKAQISALTAQMNPHLLFNSLNTIASTITTDPKSAEDMVVQLSELYRGILKSAKGDMHTLEDELFLCRSYLDIEKKRFGSRLEYKIQVDQKINQEKIKIPVLLLQPLVENAVKHGLAPKREGGKVSIDILKGSSHFVMTVLDNGVGINSSKSSTGTGSGLANCESRVKLKYGEESRFTFLRSEKNETLASISIPLCEAVHD